MRNQYTSRLKEKNCVKCSNVFIGRVTQEKCKDCQIKRNRPSLKKPFKQHTCNLCGTIFTGSVARKNCDSCSKNRPTPKTKQEKPCEWCGCEFESARKVSRFCSFRCSSFWLNATGLGPKHNDEELKQRAIQVIQKESRSMTKEELCAIMGVTHKVFKSRNFELSELYSAAGVLLIKSHPSFFAANGYNTLLALGFNPEEIEQEKTFKDLKSSKNYKLRYDFFIPKFNLAIELDGPQHNKLSHFRKSDLEFAEATARDKLKDDYAKQKGINLIRIPYENTYEKVLHKLQQTLAPFIGDNKQEPL